MNKLGRENFPFSQCYSQYDREYELFTTLCIVFVHILLHTYEKVIYTWYGLVVKCKNITGSGIETITLWKQFDVYTFILHNSKKNEN